ncbi:MAG: 3-dehydroquinate synthase [Spirochaetaceae bacterium]|nr:3-dehydroquinate synthase [Spirochaetaceae bacterium]
MDFIFNGIPSCVFIQRDTPTVAGIMGALELPAAPPRVLAICDTNTKTFAEAAGFGGGRMIAENSALCVLEPGETAKNWASVETVLRAAHNAGLGRDGLFVGIGGGVITDIAAFAASIYMRGTHLALISTTLLGMADAAVGGKTGIDLFGIKNFAGTFYPARAIWMPLSTVSTLPPAQWKSGMAEIIKAAILSDDEKDFWNSKTAFPMRADDTLLPQLEKMLVAAVRLKGRIVESDPLETGAERALLNLGHTFGHALEACVGLSKLTHGEAVAWGIARACELGVMLGITPAERARAIIALLDSFGYNTAAGHPALPRAENNQVSFMKALSADKKNKDGKMRFVIPSQKGAVLVSLMPEQHPLVCRSAFGAWE